MIEIFTRVPSTPILCTGLNRTGRRFLKTVYIRGVGKHTGSMFVYYFFCKSIYFVLHVSLGLIFISLFFLQGKDCQTKFL